MYSKTCTVHSRPSQRVNRDCSALSCIFRKKPGNGLTIAMKAGSECWWTVPSGAHRSCGTTWLDVQDGTTCASSRTRRAQLLLSCTFLIHSSIRTVQMPELNRIAGEGLSVIHREEFQRPAGELTSQHKALERARSQQSALPSTWRLRWLEQHWRWDCTECRTECSDGNWFTALATEALALSQCKSVNCTCSLVLQSLNQQLGNRARQTKIFTSATQGEKAAVAQREGGSLIWCWETEEGGAFGAVSDW